MGKILVVDDDYDAVEIMTQYLDGHGHQSFKAYSGQEVFNLIKTEKPDLILLDIMMPQMDGFEVAKRLKDKNETKDIPLIFVTARGDLESKVKGLSLGAVDYISKPFSLQELAARINVMLQMKRQHQELIKLNEMKSEFLSIASHDAKNPLASILNITKNILKTQKGEKLSARQEQDLERINENARFALSMIENLLNVAILDLSPLKIEKIEIPTIIDQCIYMNEVAAKSREITITKKVPKTLPPLKADEEKILELLDNLITNAIKFTPNGKNINIEAKVEKGNLHVSVKDEGVGIPAQELPLVFVEGKKLSPQPFQQARGTGLGLKICKKIVDLHQGEIWVESQVGQGTTFTFSLPIKKD